MLAKQLQSVLFILNFDFKDGSHIIYKNVCKKIGQNNSYLSQLCQSVFSCLAKVTFRGSNGSPVMSIAMSFGAFY